MFFSITGGVLIYGPTAINENKIDSHIKSDFNYYTVFYENIKDLTKSGKGSTTIEELNIEEGSVEIDSEGDRVALSYSYHPDFDFTVSDGLEGDDSFTVEMNDPSKSIDKAKVTWLNDTCFLAGTKVLMTNYSYKNIEDVQIGDMVISYDEINITLVSDTVKSVHYHNASEMGEYYLVFNNELCVTPNHIIYVNDEWIKASEISIGDSFFDKNFGSVLVYSIEKLYKPSEVYDLQIELYNNFFVKLKNKDILVHNPLYGEINLLAHAGPTFSGVDYDYIWEYTVGDICPHDQQGATLDLYKDGNYNRHLCYPALYSGSITYHHPYWHLDDIYGSHSFYVKMTTEPFGGCNSNTLSITPCAPHGGACLDKPSYINGFESGLMAVDWSHYVSGGNIDIYSNGVLKWSGSITNMRADIYVTEPENTITLEYQGNVIDSFYTYYCFDGDCGTICWRCNETTNEPESQEFNEETDCADTLYPYNDPEDLDCYEEGDDPGDGDGDGDFDPIWISVTNPQEDDIWTIGESEYITWNYDSEMVGETVSISLQKLNQHIQTIPNNIAIEDKYYYWNPIDIPLDLTGDDFRIKIKNNGNTGGNIVTGYSDYFTINPPENIDISITKPNITHTFYIGDTETITWDPDIFSGTIDLYLIGDNKNEYLIEGDIELIDGSYEWTIPAATIPAYGYKIKITEVNNPSEVYSISERFMIKKSTKSNLYEPGRAEILRTGAEKEIKWTYYAEGLPGGGAFGGSGNLQKGDIELYYCFEQQTTIATDVTLEDESYLWTIDVNDTGERMGFGYVIYIYDNKTLHAMSEPFTIVPGGIIEVTRPNSDTTWTKYNLGEIAWDFTNHLTGKTDIYLYQNNQYIKQIDNGDVELTQREYTWENIDVGPGTGYKVKIECNGITDESEAFDITVDPNIDIIKPSENEIYLTGEGLEILWNYAELSGIVDIKLYKNGNYIKDLANKDIDIIDQHYIWENIDVEPDNGYTIKLTCQDITEESDIFQITDQPIIIITEPDINTIWNRGEPANIRWQSAGLTGQSIIKLYKNNNFIRDIATPDIDSGSYTIDEVTDNTGEHYTINIICTGIENTSGEFQIVDDLIAPTCSLTVNKTSGYRPLKINFIGNAHDTDGEFQSWELDFGDGNNISSNPDDIIYNPFSLYGNYTYTTPGIKKARFTVTDNDGLSTYTEKTIIVRYSNNVYICDDIDGDGYQHIGFNLPDNCGDPTYYDSTEKKDFTEFNELQYGKIMLDDDNYTETKSTYTNTGETVEVLSQQNYQFYINENPDIINSMKITWIGKTEYTGSNFYSGIDVYNHNTEEHISMKNEGIHDYWFSKTYEITENIEEFLKYDSNLNKYLLNIRAWASTCNINSASATIKARYIEVEVIIDDNPSCSISLPDGIPSDDYYVVQGPIVVFDMDAMDDKLISSYNLDLMFTDHGQTNINQDNWQGTFSYNYSTRGEGIYTAILNVTDDKGNTGSDSVDFKVVLHDISPPTCELNSDISLGSSPCTVEFNFNASDEDGELTFWNLTFDDGNYTNKDISSLGLSEIINQRVEHRYETDTFKTYNAYLEVKDNDGLYSARYYKNIMIIPSEQPPNAEDINPTYRYSDFYNETEYTFRLVADDCDEDDVYCYIDWGDGSNSGWTGPYKTGSNADSILASHSWRYSGVYEIKFKARDNLHGESEWSDPYAIKIGYKFLSFADEKEKDEPTITNQGNGVYRIENLKENLEGAVCIQLFSDDYPYGYFNPEDQGKTSFGAIWIFNLGLIKHKFDSQTDNTIFETGALITNSNNEGYMDNLLSLKEEAEAINFNILLIRGQNKISAGGKGIYQIQLKNNGTYVRENINSEVYNIRLEIKGENKNHWLEHLNTYYNYDYETENILKYKSDQGINLLFSTTILNTEIKNIL